MRTTILKALSISRSFERLHLNSTGGRESPRRPGSSFGRLALPALLFAALVTVGCGDDGGGPGELTGTVVSPGPALGGAVLEVVGKGVTGFSGAGATRVYYAPTQTEGTFRVVLLSSSSSGPLQFRVAVQDVGAKKPSASLVNLTSVGNLPLPATSEYSVTFSK
jgi:hypothetical protein